MKKRVQNPRITDRLARKWARKVVEVIKRMDSPKSPYRRRIKDFDRVMDEGLASSYSTTIFLGEELVQGESISVLVELIRTSRTDKTLDAPVTVGGHYGDGELRMDIYVPSPKERRKSGKKGLEEFHEGVREVLKHEFEHVYQDKRKDFKMREPHPHYVTKLPKHKLSSIVAQDPRLKTVGEAEDLRKSQLLNYLLERGEIEAYVAGLYLTAKKRRIPFKTVACANLDLLLPKKDFSREERAVVWDAWMDEARRRYPRAVTNPKKKPRKKSVKKKVKKRKRKDARDDFVLVRKKDQDGWLEFAFIEDRSIRLFVFEDEDGHPRWNGMVVRKGECYEEVGAKTYQGIFSKAVKYAMNLPEPQDGEVKAIIKKFRRAGNSLPPSMQIGTGVVVAGVPIPEPVMETATNIAGVVMIKDGVERIRKNRTGRWKERIPGGLAAGMHPSDFDKKALKKGIKVELEHTGDRDIATEIAMDHLIEDPDYYEKQSWPKRKVRKKPSKKKKVAKLDTSHWDDYRLIKHCQKLWEHYCARPSKKRLKEVFDHLEKMKTSKTKSVTSERRRCLRAANLEAKRLKLRR